jgi:UDP-glucose 4-epimerase
MAKILISGVAGFVGSHLADRLLKDGHHVVGVDNLICGDVHNIPRDLHWTEADCTIPPRHLFAGADVVYHLAAVPYEGLSLFSPSLVSPHNVSTTASMAAAAVSAGVKRFVYASSLSRYGYSSRVPFTEEMSTCPQSPYGISKICAEHILKVIGFNHKMETVIAVLHNTIGTRQQYDDPYRNVAAGFVNQLLQNKRPFIYGDGKQKRSFVAVEDVVEALAIAGFKGGLDGETINVGRGDKPISIFMLGSLIANVIGVPFNPVLIPGPPGEVVHAWPSTEKQKRLLGFEAKVKLEDALALMVDDICARGAKEFRYHAGLEVDPTRPPWWKRMFC